MKHKKNCEVKLSRKNLENDLDVMKEMLTSDFGSCRFGFYQQFINWIEIWIFQVLVLLDIVPDQSMLDEGVAREVINRVQKLRQKVRGQCCIMFYSKNKCFGLFVEIQKQQKYHEVNFVISKFSSYLYRH